MDEIKVTTLNEDGTVQFTGTLKREQVGFILGVGINYLLQQGTFALLDEDDDDLPEQNAPTSGNVQ